MRILVVAQNKGGDGKTTLSRLVSEYLARAGLRVLAIDLDPQANLSQRFLKMDIDETGEDTVLPPIHPEYAPDSDPDDASWNGRSSAADIFQAQGVFAYTTGIENLDILPAYGKELRDIELVTKDAVKARVHDALKTFLANEEVRDTYDVIVIDTSPSKGPLSQSAIRAATHMIIPCQMEQQSIEGLHGMLQLARRENRLRAIDDPLKLIGILPTKFRKGVAIQEGIRIGLQADETIAPYLIPHVLGLRSPFSESDHPGTVPRSLFDLNPRIQAKVEAEAVCKFITAALLSDEEVLTSEV